MKYLYSILQTKTIEIYIIEIDFRQESIRKIVRFEKKVNKSGKSYNIYNHNPYLSKIYQKQV